MSDDLESRAAPVPDRHATPLLRRGYDYWNGKRAGRAMPARADIDPLEIVPLLPHVALIDVLRGARPGWPLDFRYRLMGTAIDYHMSRSFTGLCLSEVPHQRPGSQLWGNFAAVVETARPRFNAVPYVGPHKDFLAIVDVILPLSADGAHVDMLMSFIDFVPRTIPA